MARNPGRLPPVRTPPRLLRATQIPVSRRWTPPPREATAPPAAVPEPDPLLNRGLVTWPPREQTIRLAPGRGGWYTFTWTNDSPIPEPLAEAEIAEQNEWMRLQAEQNAREAAEAMALRAEADRRAYDLLMSVLRPEQRAEYQTHGYVTERSPAGRTWRFTGQAVGGVYLLNDAGQVRAEFCVHPRDTLPAGDNIVALLLALRCGDEDVMLATAILQRLIEDLTPEERAIRGTGRGQPCGCHTCVTEFRTALDERRARAEAEGALARLVAAVNRHEF